jgi:hypothetical protein
VALDTAGLKHLKDVTIWGSSKPPGQGEKKKEGDSGTNHLNRTSPFTNSYKSPAIYGFLKGGAKFPGLVQIHGGGQYADANAAASVIVEMRPRFFAKQSRTIRSTRTSPAPSFFPHHRWKKLDQSVHGKDFWQTDYDPSHEKVEPDLQCPYF